MAVCPKCGAERPQDATECPQCGIIYARYEAAQAKKQEDAAEAARRAQIAAMQAEEAAAPASGTAQLIKCAACGKDVSVMADACPSCGHPVDKMLHLSPAERTMTQFFQALLGFVILFVLVWIVYCSLKSPSGHVVAPAPPSAPATKPAQMEKPGIRTNVPLDISADAIVIGCHDINDFWMVEGFRRGKDATWKQLLRERVQDGRCGRVAAGRGVAVEILPSGVAEIRDSRGAKWYVNDDALKGHGAY